MFFDHNKKSLCGGWYYTVIKPQYFVFKLNRPGTLLSNFNVLL